MTDSLVTKGYKATFQTYAQSGQTVNGSKNGVDAWLATATSTYEKWVLINLGANDLATMPGTLEADLGYIADAMHVKFPIAQILIMRPWIRFHNSDADTFAGIVDNVIATRGPWAALGPDERVFLKGSDDGVSETVDGVHPNATYYGLGVGTAGQWLTSMGF